MFSWALYFMNGPHQTLNFSNNVGPIHQPYMQTDFKVSGIGVPVLAAHHHIDIMFVCVLSDHRGAAQQWNWDLPVPH